MTEFWWWPIVKWVVIPGAILFVLFADGITVPKILIAAALVYAGIKWENRKIANKAPEVGEFTGNTIAKWTPKRGYDYPPGLEQKSRSEFTTEEQAFIENAWFADKWKSNCERAGLVRREESDDPAKPGKEFYPSRSKFAVDSEGISFTVFPASTGIAPSQIEAAKESLFQDVAGYSEILTRVHRTGVVFLLQSRDALAADVSATEVFGTPPPPPAQRDISVDDFLREMGDDDA